MPTIDVDIVKESDPLFEIIQRLYGEFMLMEMANRT